MNQNRLIYFVGIGGIGMSALARFFKHEGYTVAGYDRTPTALTDNLQAEGIAVHFEDSVENIPQDFRSSEVRVIYTPAIPKDSAELNYFISNGNEVIKRSRALGLLSEGKHLEAVAGTHGKTSTSTMAAWFNSAGIGEGSAFLGGISKNFGTNMVMGSGDKLVVEADEFDRSFLQLYPNSAVVTAADPDHLDIYGTPEEFRCGFEQFVSQIKPGGRVVIKKGVELTVRNSEIEVMSYSLEDTSCDYYARNIELLEGGKYRFDIVTPSRIIERCELGIPGLVNVENCVAAVALIDTCDFSVEKLKEAIHNFVGVQRRFDFYINTPECVYMDDYAHHPNELTPMLKSVRKMFPNRHVTVVFQPHLYTRTRDFHEGFAQALSIADRAIILPIYPARELPIEGVESQIIYNLVTTKKELQEKETLVERLNQLQTDIVVTAGAGDIDKLVSPIAQMLRAKIK